MSTPDRRSSEHVASWLCPSPGDRARMLELDDRLGALGNLIQPLLPLSLILAAFWVGPWALLPVAFPVPLFIAMPKLMPRMAKPEWLFLAALLSLACTLGVAIAFTGGLDSPLVFWLLFMVVGVAARFNRRGLILATAVIAAAGLAGVVGAGPGEVLAQLPALVTIVAVGFVSAHYTRVLALVEHHYRREARLDPLTGLLNRTSLHSRFGELSQQAAQNDGSICLVMCDLDHFKQVNDRHGHDGGDAVLRRVSRRLRSATHSFELIYRVGGEEFLLVLPGVEIDDGRRLAERLRSVIEDPDPDGPSVTASFGVTAGRGAQIDFDELYRAADEALYEAKAAGRNRVATAPAPRASRPPALTP
ncbi:MAG: GGDEF domain-containing protein [Acidimicrobiales bacterium]